MASVLVMGTFDSKGQEHAFLRDTISRLGQQVVTMNIGTGGKPLFVPDIDVGLRGTKPREQAVEEVTKRAVEKVRELMLQGLIGGVISCGGGTGTHMATSIMRTLPFGIPKVMVSTVASRDLSRVIATSDITVMHSVADLVGINSITGTVLEQAAAAICAMVKAGRNQPQSKGRIALSNFGFISEGARKAKDLLEDRGYEVVLFHTNGIGGRAMEELASKGVFRGVLDMSSHELADELLGGYCKGAGDWRLCLPGAVGVPRVVVPGGLDCAVFERWPDTGPLDLGSRKVFPYDFRYGVGLTPEESTVLGEDLGRRLKDYSGPFIMIVPLEGWSEADGPGRPLHDPKARRSLLDALVREASGKVALEEVPAHINDEAFCIKVVDALERLMGKGGPQ